MAGIEDHKAEFDALNVALIGASADEEDPGRPATETAKFPVAYGLTVEDAKALGALTGGRQGISIVQPCEFVINPEGKVMASMYATTQLGRMYPEEVIRFITARS